MLTHVNFPTVAMTDLRYGGPSLWRADATDVVLNVLHSLSITSVL